MELLLQFNYYPPKNDGDAELTSDAKHQIGEASGQNNRIALNRLGEAVATQTVEAVAAAPERTESTVMHQVIDHVLREADDVITEVDIASSTANYVQFCAGAAKGMENFYSSVEMEQVA